MTAIVWDQIADRRFEAGVDRGVLYPLGKSAVPWNGLVSVQETRTREVKSYYLDGMKYLDHVVPGAYAAKISAYTYPKEMDEIVGTAEFLPGVNVHDQRFGMFHLSYRTLIGNVEEGLDFGYTIHLVYNLTAVPDDVTNTSLGAKVDPITFGWNVSAVGTIMWGIRPTSHLSFNSKLTDPDMLTYIEESIYGTDATDPEMPDLVTLLKALEDM